MLIVDVHSPRVIAGKNRHDFITEVNVHGIISGQFNGIVTHMHNWATR